MGVAETLAQNDSCEKYRINRQMYVVMKKIIKCANIPNT